MTQNEEPEILTGVVVYDPDEGWLDTAGIPGADGPVQAVWPHPADRARWVASFSAEDANVAAMRARYVPNLAPPSFTQPQ